MAFQVFDIMVTNPKCMATLCINHECLIPLVANTQNDWNLNPLYHVSITIKETLWFYNTVSEYCSIPMSTSDGCVIFLALSHSDNKIQPKLYKLEKQ